MPIRNRDTNMYTVKPHPMFKCAVENLESRPEKQVQRSFFQGSRKNRRVGGARDRRRGGVCWPTLKRRRRQIVYRSTHHRRRRRRRRNRTPTLYRARQLSTKFRVAYKVVHRVVAPNTFLATDVVSRSLPTTTSSFPVRSHTHILRSNRSAARVYHIRSFPYVDRKHPHGSAPHPRRRSYARAPTMTC